MVLITKQQKRAVYDYLLEEGVLVVKKVNQNIEVGCSYAKAPSLGYAKPQCNLHYAYTRFKAICD